MELLNEETMIFEVMLQNLKPGQISFLYALAKEPIITPFNIDYCAYALDWRNHYIPEFRSQYLDYKSFSQAMG